MGATLSLQTLFPLSNGLAADISGRASGRDPFRLGVASGSPTSSAVVLWTRLAPDPLAEGGGMPPRAVPVRWVMALSPDLSRPVASGTATARPDRAHSVHVDVRHLAPDTRYWYRFFVGDAASPIGATKTLPAPLSSTREVRFATLCCQNYAHGYFTGYDAIVEDEPDFVLHLGDYIYETDFGTPVRPHETTAPLDTLDAFRRRHALYKMDPSLARAHAMLPFFATLDNHDAAIDASPATRSIRALAYRAWLEHMPVRHFLEPDGHANIAQSIVVGDLVHIAVPDTRQFRDTQAICTASATPQWGFGNYRIACDNMDDPHRTMLGVAQEQRLQADFRRLRRRWNVLASTVPVAPFVMADGPYRRAYVASWDGYPAARQRLLSGLRAAGIGNVVVLSGDVHSSWIMDLRERADDPASLIGTEIVATSLSSDCPRALSDPMTANVSHNPHVRFFDVDRRGYVLNTVDRDHWRAALKFVDDVKVKGGTTRTGKQVVIAAGRPGIQDLV
jgi:alkaline phosphatase D